jgi:hypothetical protein
MATNIGTWCDDCHGYVHAPWCPAYEPKLTEEEAQLVIGAIPLQALPNNKPAPPAAGVTLNRSEVGWQVEQLPIHGCHIVDNTGRLIAADVYDEAMAHQIVTEHNQHQQLVAALRQVRAMFFEDARSGANVVDGKLVIADDDLHPWIPGARAPRAIAIIDAALNET